jgi:hypothetical protein
MNLLRTVTLDRANRKKDKSVSLTFTTQLEESSEGFMEIDKLLGDSGVLYFKDSGNLTAEEVKELDNVEIEVEGKTKSQKFRGILWVLWSKTEALKNPCRDFKQFYNDEMNIISEHFKNKIPE